LKILYIGDVMGEAGISVVEQVLPGLVAEHQFDLVIAQGENVSVGKGMYPRDMDRLLAAGVQFFTGGNHTPFRPELHSRLDDFGSPVIGPANMDECPGLGYKFIDIAKARILVISLLGTTVGRDYPHGNPLKKIDAILDQLSDTTKDAIIVNFHGDYSSEKKVIGYYLDGQVDAVIGDHWHIPTADAMTLPKGTMHITDVGMCGSLHSSLGIELDTIITRWKDEKKTKNIQSLSRPYQFNAVILDTTLKTISTLNLQLS
jgi:2',3'-cyclic-nucleotide 2'-phosphodiesterase